MIDGASNRSPPTKATKKMARRSGLFGAQSRSPTSTFGRQAGRTEHRASSVQILEMLLGITTKKYQLFESRSLSFGLSTP